MNQYLKKWLVPHLIAFVVLLAFALLYFSPASIDGKTLGQSDVLQAGGSQAELKYYTQKEGREILWTNGMFSGMPTFQVWGGGGNSYNYIPSFIYSKVFLLGKSVSNPYALFFAALLGFYFLLTTLKIDWRLAILGSILYGLSTTHMILIEAGHVNKMLTLAFLAPTLAGIIMTFRGQYLLGGAITALFTCCQFMANHVQITYYFFMLVALLGLAYMVQAIRTGEMVNFAKSAVVAALAVLIGVMPNVTKMWTTYEYGQESIRGKTEITGQKDKAADGLTKEYAFGWSMGKMESFSLLVPNFMGATDSEAFAQDQDSKTFKALMAMGKPEQAQQLAQATTHYWGAQPFTSGAPYYGIVLFLLFCLGIALLDNVYRWWGIAALTTTLVISWGSNFEALNFFLFDHFPFFNKFRSVNMATGLGHVVLVMIGMMGLQKYFSNETTKEQRQKALYTAVGVTGGLLVVVLLYGIMSDYMSVRDENLAQFPNLLSAIREDRASLLMSDAYRSLFYCILAGGVLFMANRVRISPYLSLALLGVIALIDLIGVDKRYLANDSFVFARQSAAVAEPRAVDKLVLQDKDPNFRVLDISRGNPYSNAITSYFFKSLGGYHAAKMGIYQDIIEKYLSNPQQYPGVINMLNTKYFIVGNNKKEPQAIPNPEANGNAWFAKSYFSVPTANAELDTLGGVNTKSTVVLQQKFADKLNGLTIQYDSTNTVKLTNYIPDHLTYEYKAKTEQLMVFSEIYYPEAKGMHAYIDGVRVKDGVLKANYVLRALRVPAGDHKVEFKFEPDSYFTGQTIGRVGSILLLLLLGAGFYFSFKNKDYLIDLVKNQGALSNVELVPTFADNTVGTGKVEQKAQVKRK